jgi:cytochrome P450
MAVIAASWPSLPALLSKLLSSALPTLGTLSALGVGYWIAVAVYRWTLHPLATFPGPFSSAISRMPWWWACIKGTQIFWIKELHDRYGPVVRFGPNDLSYIDCGGETWQAIHGFEKGRPEYPKAKEFHFPPHNGISPITSADFADHRRFRRVLAPAFSDRALRAQQPLFLRHVDTLVATLRDVCRNGAPVQMVQMYNFTTFDIMGDLTFGQPLGLLENRKYSPEVEAPFSSMKVLSFIQMIEYYPLLKAVWTLLEPQVVRNMLRANFNFAVDRVDKRLEKGSDQPDIWNIVLSAADGKGMTVPEMHSNSDLFILAGSETTATLLSGLTYHLLTNQETMAALVAEIRGTFSTDGDIDMQRLAGLPYLSACMQEALRMYPPIAMGIPRCVTDENGPGNIILGKVVPPGTRVSVQHYVTYRSPLNFADPDEFAPERWLGTKDRFKNDRLSASQPFSFGPRNCIGQNMALHEMRLIIAKVLFNFDLELCDESRGWDQQRLFILWEKKELWCRLKPVH